MRSEPIRVLLVDDDQGDFEMVRVMLAQTEHQHFKLDWVSTFEEALDAFEANEHQVYFLDYFLEDRTGLDLLREAKARGVTAPVIMLTGRGNRTVDMEAMEMGASDYLVKGTIDPDSLERAIRHAMERVEGTHALNTLKQQDAQTKGIISHVPGEVAGEQLPLSAARFRVVYESSRSGIAILDLAGMISGVNPAFAEFFAPSRRWTEGFSYLDLLDEGDRDPVSKELQALAGGKRTKFEAARRFLVREGDVLWAHTTVHLVKDAQSTPNHIVVLLEPIPEGP